MLKKIYELYDDSDNEFNFVKSFDCEDEAYKFRDDNKIDGIVVDNWIKEG